MKKGVITITAGVVTRIETKAGKGFVIVEKVSPVEFFSCMGSEQDGGGQETGTLQNVLSSFNKDVAKTYKALFKLTEATEETISQAGFTNYELIFK